MSDKSKEIKNYKGFVAGVFSGIAKLSGHPFDTIKVRLQSTPRSHFSGPIQCLLLTLRNEGIPGLYKGATPPLLGWMVMDSITLGSLAFYRRLLHENFFTSPAYTPSSSPHLSDGNPATARGLPTIGHALAGVMSGSTVSLLAAPVEHIKARLQTQYSAVKAERRYQSPLHCVKQIYAHHGISGVYHGLTATLIFRSFFFFWWGSYDVISRFLERYTDLSAPARGFWAGGASAQFFWLTAYPADVIKQQVMTDPLGGTLGDGVRRFSCWREAAWAVGRQAGWRGYWRGFSVCFLRAFPANAVALAAFEGVLKGLPD